MAALPEVGEGMFSSGLRRSIGLDLKMISGVLMC